MNLSWHIAKKDIRRFWAPLVALCAITALRLIVGICLLKSDGSDPEYFGRMAVYSNIMWGIGLFLTYMLVGAVIHEDSVASQAFWQTRPISGVRLLAGKSLGLFLMFGLLPVLLLVPWWLGCGFGWSEIWRSVAETLAIQLGVVLLALPWSAVTRDDGRFLLWTVVVAVAFATAFLVLVGQHKVAQPDIMPWFGMARLIAVLGLAFAGSLGVSIHQFVTRRTANSVVFIIVTAGLMVSAGQLAKWNGWRLGSPRFSTPKGLAKDITLSFGSSEEWSAAGGYGVGEVDLIAKHVPSQYGLAPLYSEQNLRWSDGSVTDAQARFESWGMPWYWTDANGLLRLSPEPLDRDWVKYNRLRYLFRRPPQESNKTGDFTEPFTITFSPVTVIRLIGEKPSYEGSFWFRSLRPEVVGEKNVQIGSEFFDGSSESRLVAVENDKARQDLWLSFVERSPEHLWTDLKMVMNLAPLPNYDAYFVVNKKRSYAPGGSNVSTVHALIGNVSIVLRKDGFRSRNLWNASKHTWEKETGGFDDATVAEIGYREMERFSLPLTKDGFSVRPVVQTSGALSPKRTISVAGEVSKPGDLEVYSGETVIFALRLAGGVSEQADLKKVELRRTAADGSTTTIIVDVDSWLSGELPYFGSVPYLEPGDVIFVPRMESGRSP